MNGFKKGNFIWRNYCLLFLFFCDDQDKRRKMAVTCDSATKAVSNLVIVDIMKREIAWFKGYTASQIGTQHVHITDL